MTDSWTGNAVNLPGPSIFPSSGSFFGPTLHRQNGADFTPEPGVLYSQPIFLGKAITLASLTVQITASGDSSSLLRLGIYHDSGRIFPSDLLLDAGAIDGSQPPGPYSIATDLPLIAGVYWLAGAVTVATTPPSLKNSVRGASYYQLLGDPTTNPGYLFTGSDATAGTEGWRMDGVTDALPANFSETGTRLTAGSLMIVGQVA